MNHLDLRQEVIDLDNIDFVFTPFSFSYGFELTEIKKSIQKVGLINEPILKEQNEKFVIVTGYKRLLAIKELGWDRVGGRIISNSRITSLQCLLISLYDNIPQRNLNEIEKAIILSRLSRYIPADQIIREYMPLLGLPRYKRTLDMYKWIENELEDEQKRLVIEGRISVNSLRLFFDWNIPKEDIDIYTWILKNLKFSLNQQRQLIEYCYDICRERNISLDQFLLDTGIRDLIEDTTLNINDKIKKIMDIIRQERFPYLYEARERFYKRIKRMNLPEGVLISAPPYFESPYYKMEILFRDGGELRHKIAELNNIDELEDIGDPWQKG